MRSRLDPVLLCHWIKKYLDSLSNRIRCRFIFFPLWTADSKISGVAGEFAGCMCMYPERKICWFKRYPHMCGQGLYGQVNQYQTTVCQLTCSVAPVRVPYWQDICVSYCLLQRQHAKCHLPETRREHSSGTEIQRCPQVCQALCHQLWFCPTAFRKKFDLILDFLLQRLGMIMKKM